MPMRKGFPFRRLFNYQLTKLEESGTLSHLRKKWISMRKYSLEYLCDKAHKDSSAVEHDKVVWTNVSWNFWLLLLGIGKGSR